MVTFTYDNAGKEACESAKKLLAGETIDPQWVLETNTIDSSNVDDWIGKGFKAIPLIAPRRGPGCHLRRPSTHHPPD